VVISVGNPSGLGARDLVVTGTLPEGLAYVASTPAAAIEGRSLTWTLGTLDGGGGREIELTVRAQQPGSYVTCAGCATKAGPTGRSCANTLVVTAER